MLDQHLNAFLLGKELKLLSAKKTGNSYLWEVEMTAGPGPCRACQSLRTVFAGRCTTTVKEEPIRQISLRLKIHKHKVFCKDCKSTRVQSVEGILPKHKTTQRFRKFIAQSSARLRDLESVRKLYKVSNGFIYKVYYEQIEIKLHERQAGFKWPEVIGLDEHFFRRKKGFTEFVTVFTDLRKKRIFEIAEGKNIAGVIEQVKNIPGRENVKLVVIDMSGTYKSLIKQLFPSAKIVADKFHVLRLFTPHIMKAGAAIHGHRKDLKNRRKLLRSRSNLDYSERSDIDKYLRNYPALNELYRAKERLCEFFRIKGVVRAAFALEKLITTFMASGLEAINKIAGTLKRWRQEILSYFAHRYTNGFTERTNGTGKLVQTLAYGYKSFKNYRLRVLSACLFKLFL